ncbi:MAG TPA: hypothetical protein VMO26_29485 [Vicinamibacterales bacterium]|nr:hypothetical protein [Vicinamibacterales bacterium]
MMDQWTRRIVGLGVHCGVVDGVGLCRMFNRATQGHTPPTYLSADHDPLYRFHQWQANLRILDVREIKSVAYVPLSHPFVERLMGTVRRECLDRTLFLTRIWSCSSSISTVTTTVIARMQACTGAHRNRAQSRAADPHV